MGFLGQSMTNSRAWSVSDLTGYIKELFDIDFRLQDVEVQGEISNFTQARSGHLYFTLKDDQAQIKCVMWRSAAQRLNFHPQEGDAILVQGRISVYEPGGVYQLYAERIEQAGRGDLALAFERLKEKLASEGLFDHDQKKPIPRFPNKLGIVTSADGAALRDILNVIKRRCPLISILIAPSLVQGDRAPEQIVRALQWLDARSDIDTIIIARGGGSIEDLWAFNDERVARSVFMADHPIICGVGHETDFTISDFVADLRAPTPSAAAELAVPDLSDLPLYLTDVKLRQANLIETQLQRKTWQLASQKQRLAQYSPNRSLEINRQRLDNIIFRLENTVGIGIRQFQRRFEIATARLNATSPMATLSRGYAIVRKENGQIVRQAKRVEAGDNLLIQVSEGSVGAIVSSTHEGH